QLTVNATNRFTTSSVNNQTGYFNDLLQEISKKVPVRRERLTTDGHFQYVQSISGTNLQFSIQISSIISTQNEISVPGVISSLDNMIKYKTITTFASGLTSDLDSTYGFKQKSNLFGEYKTSITSFAVFSLVNIVLYGISQFAKSDSELEANDKDNMLNHGLRFLNGVTGGFFVISHSYFFTHFSFDDTNSKPEFSLPR
ncbi:2940_t:CDS:2, partial [Dentiscutata heterogama]